MEYIYAALLLNEAGKEINEENLMQVVKAAGIEPDQAKAKVVADALKNVNIKEILQNAQSMQIASAPQANTAQQAAAQKEEKKEEKNDEPAASGLAALFG
ncbi:MAG: 50S ribosomal protein P1 [Candidatus Micrarchaeota archaeon]|nr:MAG: 50S ribosomal protein P1 [Candidatus Micrarchaeota archaeon]